VKYAFIQAHQTVFRVRVMCRVLKVHHSGFYGWVKKPLSKRARDDNRLIGLIKQAWLESGCVYGYRKLHDDLRSLGETCCPNRVARLASIAGIKAQIGYRRKAGFYGGKPAIVAANRLQQDFKVALPDHAWVMDITYTDIDLLYDQFLLAYSRDKALLRKNSREFRLTDWTIFWAREGRDMLKYFHQ